MTQSLGRMLLILGGLLMLLGVVLVLAQNVPFLGRLPGDIRYESNGTTVYIPITTCLILSIILTLLLNVGMRWLAR